MRWHPQRGITGRATRQLGLRGAFLAGIATLDLVWAWSLLDATAARPLLAAPSFHVVVAFGRLVNHDRPLLLWAVLLGGVGVTCGVTAWRDDDRAGYAAAVAVKVLLAVLTIAAWPVAHVQILRAAAQWVCLAVLVAAAQAGIPYRRD